MRIRIWPYKQGSRSAKALSDALEGKVLKRDNSNYRPRRGDILINWGSSTARTGIIEDHYINCPNSVLDAGNKLTFFQHIWGDHPLAFRVPNWTITKANAEAWLAEKKTVVARTVLTGHSGQGIIIVRPGETLPDAPLYVEYIKKDSEYRIHIMRGNVIDVQRKVRDPSREPTNWAVRSHANGFIFVRGSTEPNKDVIDQACAAFNVSGLDFGAVDVIWNARRGQAFVLEINTAPGLEGQTVDNYARAIKAILN